MKVICRAEGIGCAVNHAMHGYLLRQEVFRGLTFLPLYFAHRRCIGGASVRATPNGIEVSAKFTLDLDRPDDEEIFRHFRTGLLRSFSISFIPGIERSWDDVGPVVLTRAVVSEISICELGANPAALIRSRSWRVLTPTEVLQGG
jgi:hypothetical protein